MKYNFDVIISNKKFDDFVEKMLEIGVEVKVSFGMDEKTTGVEFGEIDESVIEKVESLLMSDEFDGVQGNIWE